MWINTVILLLFITQISEQVQSECLGGVWTIQDTAIGSFTVSWRYNTTLNILQFTIRGQVNSNVNLTSTYIALSWSEIISTRNADVILIFPDMQIIRDGYFRGQAVPLIDLQQDLCMIQTNLSDQNIDVNFERSVSTGDIDDISFTSDIYLTFSMGSYIVNNDTNEFDLSSHFFQKSHNVSINLMNCISIGCLTLNCSTTACSCLQDISSNIGQCICFQPSSPSCRSSSTKHSSTMMASSVSALINGSCENQTDPCSSHGICLQISSTHFICQCKAGYTGVLCQTSLFSPNINIFNVCQCLNGGVCSSNATCSCPENYRGKYCQLTNPCNGYCQNSNRCTVDCTDSLCDTPNCTCIDGFTGDRCETSNIDACQSNPCVNGLCIPIATNGFQCQCNNSYIGLQCDKLNTCLSNPCNQGTCVPSSNCTEQTCSYSCSCLNGTTGLHCETITDPCLSIPCQNNGSCSVLSNGYLCECEPPYNGTNCEIIPDVCIQNPCLNNGTCIRNLTVGKETYRCDCVKGYVGEHCESRDTSCKMISCENGGTCLINNETNISYCQCPSNTAGDRCETKRTLCTNTTCSNNGICFSEVLSNNNSRHCICSKGFTGQYCENFIYMKNSCSRKPCGYDGTCIQTSNSSYYCICSNGSTGQSCETNTLTSCSGSPCRYLSTCQPIEDTKPVNYRCVCPPYLTGDRCQYTNNCQNQPCVNHGTCIPLGPQNNFMCLCPPGFGHYDCSIHIGVSCNTHVCLNGGTCDDDNSTNIRCICPAGFAGPRCEWTSVCSTNTCQNNGTCRQIAPTMAECLCQTGFTGPTCALRDSCTKLPCKNGGGCTTLIADTGTNWSAYRCICPPGMYGQNCDTGISSCSNMLCPKYQICSEQPTGPICTCPENKVGTFCQYDNPCKTSTIDCRNNGACVYSNTDPPVSSCRCREGFTGTYCETIIHNNPCSSNPCQTRGHCALSTTNKTYTCICRDHFIGEFCERNNPCLSSPCLNQAMCQPYWNQTNTWFNCRCVGTYTGSRCETSLLNPCGGLCMNGSPCSQEICICPAQYTGTFCEYDNPCFQPICQNDGICSVVSNATNISFACTCPSLYTGQYCDISLNISASTDCALSCMNNGTCGNGVCLCTSKYIGPVCQYENPCANRNLCLNGGTCFSRYNLNGTVTTQCFCPQGYTGSHCEAILCSPTSCNGGVCTATQNNIVCACPKGKVGDRCQYADACARNPCLPNERCEQIGSQYQCISCYDKSSYCSIYQLRSEYCDNRYTILVDNNFLSVPQACQRSCGQCIPIQRLQDISTLFNQAELSDEINITSSTTTAKEHRDREKCVDRRDDCSMQKAYGFCRIFNEKYPEDCVKTCHPDCTDTF
ncbi:unnamed protein product [Adineta ricciae]|uniref:Uncharacterized protein n=1 Tax=Adineta ricciae TaxID=249248 RepID=A0A814NBM0_ADIRI|nr:unnamed protein product [Adineta ricciae]